MSGRQIIVDETLEINSNLFSSDYEAYEGGDNEEKKYERIR